MRFLNVGGCNKHIKVPRHFDGWEHLLLDIDKNDEVDIVCDARDMSDLPEDGYDAVYCSHNLEHYYRHDVMKVLKGFHRVVEKDGFVEIHVPNMKSLFKVLADGHDIEDVLYVSDAGPVRGVDMIYGLESFIKSANNDFMVHKNGFTPKSLGNLLFVAGFKEVFIGDKGYDLAAYAFKRKATDEQLHTLHLKRQPNPAGQGIKPVNDLLSASPEPAPAGLTESRRS